MEDISKVDEIVSTNKSRSNVISETINTELKSSITVTSVPSLSPTAALSLTKKQKAESGIG